MQSTSPLRVPLDVTSVTADILQTGGLWSSVQVVPSIESTNATLSVLAAAGSADAGTVLVAEEQTAGRGRHGREWTAPRYSSVLVSVLVRPEMEQLRWGWLPLLTALAVSDAAALAGVSATIKWPNDILAGEAKLAGILCEVAPTPTGSSVVAGWGINVNQDAGELPVTGATSIALMGGSDDRALLLVKSVRAWERWYRRWVDAPDEVAAEYGRRSSTLGRRVQANLPQGEVVRGQAVRLDPNGNLVIVDSGRERSVAAADVVHLRADGLSP